MCLLLTNETKQYWEDYIVHKHAAARRYDVVNIGFALEYSFFGKICVFVCVYDGGGGGGGVSHGFPGW